jgi:hypothetical protein
MTENARINRNSKLDRYYTPSFCTEVLKSIYGERLRHKVIGEPCAGEGHISDVLRKDNGIIEGDIDPETPHRSVDATDEKAVKEFYKDCDIIVTNPPYSAETGTAAEVINTLLTLDIPVFALLRITFLEPCLDRDNLVKDLSSVITLPRVQFESPEWDDEPSSNPATSCWFVWEPPFINEDGDNSHHHQILSREDVNDIVDRDVYSRT